VRQNGLILAEYAGANARVVEYFAFIHDLAREKDNYDPEHGFREAEIALKIAGDLIEVTERELDLLTEACHGHSDGHLDSDVTAGMRIGWISGVLASGRILRGCVIMRRDIMSYFKGLISVPSVAKSSVKVLPLKLDTVQS
jgi:hypothetical protein